MRLGTDGRKLPDSINIGPVKSLEKAHGLDLAGVFFRTVVDLSPTLDVGYLREVRAKADSLGMYLEMGLGKVNPYAVPEAPELRDLGDGDLVLGFRRMMEACAAIDCRELWVATANRKSKYKGRVGYDRFRTDVDWKDQIAATIKFLKRLAPIARDLGIHMNIETHEEIASFETVQIVEAVGPDVMGITFDTANVLQRAEHPIWAARRVAPYVRQTHVKDAGLGYEGPHVRYQMRPCGIGVIDFGELVEILYRANPDLHLSLEIDQSRDEMPLGKYPSIMEITDASWLAGHPDLSKEELEAYVELVQAYQKLIDGGERPDIVSYAARTYRHDEAMDYLRVSADHLRKVCRDRNIPLQ
jgi:sugar phosphate isomerase/epimerase